MRALRPRLHMEELAAGRLNGWLLFGVGPDADRRAKLLIHHLLKGSCLGAYSHLDGTEFTSNAIRAGQRSRSGMALHRTWTTDVERLH